MKYSWELTETEFGPFYPYIQDKNITDIDFNGKTLWVTDLKKGRYQAKAEVPEEFVERFTHRIANRVNKPFNRANNVLEAETNELRISTNPRQCPAGASALGNPCQKCATR